MEDPYPVASGEAVLEAGIGHTLQRRSSDRAFFPVEVLYGVYSGLQVGLGTFLSTDPHEIDEQRKSGDVHVSALYNFNAETLTVPAFGVKAAVNLPSGVRSRGADTELKALATKSFGRLGIHLNGEYEFLSGTRSSERDGRYGFVLGSTYPIGAPKYTRATLLADIFTEQSIRRGAADIFGVETGVRYQLTQRTVLDLGVGSELAGAAERSSFFITTGFSFGF